MQSFDYSSHTIYTNLVIQYTTLKVMMLQSLPWIESFWYILGRVTVSLTAEFDEINMNLL